MSADDPSPPQPEPAEAPAPGGPRRRRPRRIPPLHIWIILGLCLAVIVGARLADVAGDRAVQNVLTLIFGFVGCTVIGIWFLFRSGYSRRLRWGSATALLAALVAFVAAFEMYEVSGELVPHFRLRGSGDRQRSLDAAPPAGVDEVDMSVRTGHDFPQFLGPQRNAKVDFVRLADGWSSQPPRLVWRQPVGEGWSAFAAVNGLAVTMEQHGEEEMVTCYRVETGQLLWLHAYPARHSTFPGGTGPRSTPTIANCLVDDRQVGRVYALGAMGTLLCLDGATGTVVWREDLLERYGIPREADEKAIAWGRAASPLVIDDLDLVVVPAGGPLDGPHVSLAAFDKNDGRLVWEGGRRQASYSSPAIATLGGVRQVLIVNQDYASGHDVASGRVLWEVEWPGKSNTNASVSQAVPLPPDRVLLSKGYGWGSQLLRLEPDDDGWQATSVWKDHRRLKTKFTNVVVHQGYVYGLSDGRLECVELDTGRQQWRGDRYGQGQILGVGDRLLVQAEAGDVALVDLDPGAFVERGRIAALDDKTWNNLCLYGPYLLVRNSAEAACYELPLR